MVKQAFIELLTDFFLIVLAGDLLYLYFVGAWYEPSRFIEVVELIALFGIMVFGIYRILYFMRRLT